MIKWHILARQYWIFDLDGTLTQPLHDFPAIKRALGVPARSLILEHLNTLAPEVAQQKVEQLNQIEAEIAENARPALGAVDLLDNLREIGRRVAIITRNTRANALVTLKRIGLSDHFAADSIIGRDTAPPKPDPRGVMQLLRGWAAHPHDTLMVGDFIIDLQTARAAGIGSIHLDPRGEFVWADLMDLGVNSLYALKNNL